MALLIGADPELFISYQGNLISSIGKIGGTKQHPMPIGNGCSLQEDNVAVEFNIPPCATADAFVQSINYTLEELKRRAPYFDFVKVASASFPEEELAHPQAREFGCEPDYNAWSGRKNPRPKCDNPFLRSAGGHVHVGLDDKDLDRRQVVKAMDLFLGVPSVRLDADKDRRKLYGSAGCWRPKPYGLEYRTLSSFWIWNEDLIRWVYHQAERAVQFVKDGNLLSVQEGQLIQDAINNSNMNSVAELELAYGI